MTGDSARVGLPSRFEVGARVRVDAPTNRHHGEVGFVIGHLDTGRVYDHEVRFGYGITSWFTLLELRAVPPLEPRRRCWLGRNWR